MSIHSAKQTLRAAIAAAAMGCAGVLPALGQSKTVVLAPVPDSARLASTLDSIRTAIGATGASAAIIFPGGQTWVGVSGEAWSGTPVTTATVFDAGSITKSYTAALVLRLVHEGVLTLDDSLARWFPGLPGVEGVTIQELLRQTSGLADYARHPGFLPEIRSKMAAPWLPEENLRFIGDPGFASGARWEYSNTNYLLLGLIAARAAKRPYSQLLREHVLDSLGLTSTFVAGEDTVPHPRAHAFVDFTGDGKPDDLSALVPDPAVTRGAGGAGAVVATAADVATFARAYYAGARAELELAGTTWMDRGDGWQYGFGVIAAPHEDDILLGHLGNTAGQSAGVWHAQADGVTVAIMSNVHGVHMAEPVQALLRQALISVRTGG